MHVEQVLADVPRHERCLCGTTGRERVRPVGRSNDRWWERLVTWMKSPA